MREIKFRAWGPNSKYMWSWSDLLLGTNTYSVFGPNSGEKILMQYTGLKDKNGKDIYEGDIVRHFTCRLFVIKHCENHARFLIGKELLTKGEAKDAEVIGNIHENPELLEAKA